MNKFRYCTLWRCCATYSSLANVSEHLRNRLVAMGVRTPTEIQEKALPVLLQGRSAVVNSETGTGKTLCYLLPIINRLLSDDETKAPYSFVLVPTAELAMQVHSTFDGLADSGWQCSEVFGDRKMTIKPYTRCVVGVPSSIATYGLQRLLKTTSVLVVDEADLLLTGGEKAATWKILRNFRALYEQNAGQRQMIFSGATMPSRGKQSALASLARWIPKSTEVIQTVGVHLPPQGVEFSYVEVVDDSHKMSLLMSLLSCHNYMSSILIFVNTTSTCEQVYNTICSSHDLPIDHNTIGRLDKGVDMDQRYLNMQLFLEGHYNVLVCTDLFARGIDIPNVDLVVLFDFPTNAADFLHRAGRTARAGKSGKVVSYVLPRDKHLCTLIEHTIGQRDSFDEELFSRKKMLKRRIGRILDTMDM